MEFMDEAGGFGAHKPASVDDFKLDRRVHDYAA